MEADTAYDNRATIEVGGVPYELEASNLACRLYAEEMAGCDAPYTGRLIHDALMERQEALDAGNDHPEWSDLPHVLAAIWAMAKAAGSTRLSRKAFVASLDHAPANLYEPVVASNVVFGELGERTFFRLPAGLRDALEPDEAQ